MDNYLLIEHLHVDGFWGKYTIDISFDKDVNILTGINGVGKTTILDILYSLIAVNPSNAPVRAKYDSALLTLSDNSSVFVGRGNGAADEIRYMLNGSEVNYEMFHDEVAFAVVSSIDSSLPSLDYIKKQMDVNPMIQSDLDLTLNQWINSYNQYTSALINRIMREKIAPEKLDVFYEPLREMERLCEELYGKSKHWMVTDDGKVQFQLEGEIKQIAPEQLSSGEKQMLILILSTFIQRKRPFIAFWDEPEVSLHIAWQQKLIRMMRTLNPNMQLIIATHSPNILYEGWDRRVINVKSVVSHD